MDIMTGRLRIALILVILCLPFILTQSCETSKGAPIDFPLLHDASYESFKTSHDPSIRIVTIYWTVIEDIYKCTLESFAYRAYSRKCPNKEEIRKNISYPWLQNYDAQNDFAIFTGLDANAKYEFKVYSYNKHGYSEQFGYLMIPTEADQLPQPIIVAEPKQTDSETILLSWVFESKSDFRNKEDFRLAKNKKLVSYYYTIFWCETTMDTNSKKCDGFLTWRDLESDDVDTEENYFVSECAVTEIKPNEKSYLFAIAVSGETKIINNRNEDRIFDSTSSGMKWLISSTRLGNRTIDY